MHTLRSPQAGDQAGAQDAPDDAAAERIERPLCVAAVISQEDHVVGVVPAVGGVSLQGVCHIPDLEAPDVLCVLKATHLLSPGRHSPSEGAFSY